MTPQQLEDFKRRQEAIQRPFRQAKAKKHHKAVQASNYRRQRSEDVDGKLIVLLILLAIVGCMVW